MKVPIKNDANGSSSSVIRSDDPLAGRTYRPPQEGDEPDIWDGPQWDLLGVIVEYLWAIGIALAVCTMEYICPRSPCYTALFMRDGLTAVVYGLLHSWFPPSTLSQIMEAVHLQKPIKQLLASSKFSRFDTGFFRFLIFSVHITIGTAGSDSGTIACAALVYARMH